MEKAKDRQSLYICGKVGHFTRNCFHKKGSKKEKNASKPQANALQPVRVMLDRVAQGWSL